MQLVSKDSDDTRNRIPLYRVKLHVVSALRLLLLLGLGFIIIYPFLAKISSMFMSTEDLKDPIVWFIPRHPTLDNIKNVIKYGQYWSALKNTLLISLTSALLQTVSCTLTAYGFAKFKFKGQKLFLALAILTIVVPPQTIYISLYTKFRFFDIWGILQAFGLPQINLTESITPMILLSSTALGLKNGLYILVLTQLFRGVPQELSEASYVDGCSVWRTFWQINLPQVKPMLISVSILSFAWMWTDTFYSNLFYKTTPVLYNVISWVRNISAIGAGGNNLLSATMVNTAVILIVLPLLIVYLIGQRYLIQGIEYSGLVG